VSVSPRRYSKSIGIELTVVVASTQFSLVDMDEVAVPDEEVTRQVDEECLVHVYIDEVVIETVRTGGSAGREDGWLVQHALDGRDVVLALVWIQSTPNSSR